jgi:HAT1-interacting factor 1
MTEISPANTKTSSEETSAGRPQQLLRGRLADLTTRASAKDAIKDYNAAAELYSQATELQAELNGEMSTENADLLFAYGKSLYNVAVSKSDVLGSKVAEETAGETRKRPSATSNTTEGSELASGRVVSSAAAHDGSENSNGAQEIGSRKPAHSQSYFQFTGDENFDDTDEEVGDENGSPAEEDDFVNAFEVLDLARVLLLRKVKELENSAPSNGKIATISPEVRNVKERLADTYDLQAEISLEAERFSDAVTDLRAALDLKHELFPLEDPSVAECHYKLSLALEFSSVTRQKDEDGQDIDSKLASIDEEMREEAAKHMETSIESCKLRISQEEKKLRTGEINDEGKLMETKRNITSVKEIVADMEQRVSYPIPSPRLELFYNEVCRMTADLPSSLLNFVVLQYRSTDPVETSMERSLWAVSSVSSWASRPQNKSPGSKRLQRVRMIYRDL